MEDTVPENLIGGARIRRRIEAVIACGMPVAVSPGFDAGASPSTVHTKQCNAMQCKKCA